MYDPLKRLLDIFGSLILLIIFSPVFLIAPMLIKLDSPGPVFYKQKRVGKNGQEFEIYKFRNMVQNADQRILDDPEFRKQFKQKEGWKIKDDPRITRVGKWLRQLSFDELPQLFNILNGDMSLVGPRAYRNDQAGNEIEEQLKLYPELRKDMEMALTVKPGLTGPWQTSGRNKLSWDKRVKLDAAYARRHSLLYDIWIILKTPAAMFSQW